MVIWTDLSTVLPQSTRVTDGRTDRILIARPRLHSMQRGKKCWYFSVYHTDHTDILYSTAVQILQLIFVRQPDQSVGLLVRLPHHYHLRKSKLV